MAWNLGDGFICDNNFLSLNYNKMDFIYVLVVDKFDWEDIVIILLEEDAIKESIKRPKDRLEIFSKSERGYIPTYNYYKNGEYIKNS